MSTAGRHPPVRSAVPHEDPIDALVLEVLDRAAGGPVERALAAVCRGHPDQADTLRRRVALLGNLGVLAEPTPSAVPERLGAFRLLRPLGAGGMGVVYLAEQDDLGRQVALKIIRPEHLFFPGARERFRREVETIARLAHPGIVPVYSVGEEGGVPWFAMELVDGCSLADVLDELRARGASTAALTGRDLAASVARLAGGEPDREGWLFAGSWEAACLRIVRQVAEAVEHAHRRDVLHRDIKPGNVMLTRGASGSQVKLLDFGLASSDGGRGLTRSGSRLGSLPYMSPEQTRGAAGSLGPRTDIYSLGVTLYELFTLRRPFEGDSDPQVMLAIQEGRRRPPREVNPSISWEAETVCLTAMETDPARRYASAADFARDLGNVLERRPVEARRAGLPLRVRRWVQRSPMRAVALALLLLLVVGGPLFFLWRERLASTAIRGHLARAERNVAQALAAVDRMLTRVGQVDLRFVPQMEPVRTALLEDAVEFTESLLAAEGDDLSARRATAEANARLGDLLVRLGRADEAEAPLRRALDLGAELLAEAPGDPELLALQARTRLHLAEALRHSGRLDEADEAHAEVEATLEALVRSQPGSRAGRLQLADALMARGLTLAERVVAEDPATFAPAEEAWGRAISTLEEQVVAVPDDATLHQRLGEARSALAQLLLEAPPQARPAPRERELLLLAVQAFDRAAALEPDDPEHRYKQLVARMEEAKTWKREEAFDTAEAIVRETLPPLGELADRYPGTPHYALELAAARNELANIFDWQRRPQEAAEWYRPTVELVNSLVRRYPHLHDLHNKAGIAEMNLGAQLLTLDQPAEAREHFEQAVAQQQEAIRIAPENASYRASLRWHYRALADSHMALGDPLTAADAAAGIVSALPDDWESHTRAAALVARSLGALRARPDAADEARRAEQDDLARRAVVHLRDAIAHGFPHLDELATAPPLQPLHGTEPFDALLAEHAGP